MRKYHSEFMRGFYGLDVCLRQQGLPGAANEAAA